MMEGLINRRRRGAIVSVPLAILAVPLLGQASGFFASLTGTAAGGFPGLNQSVNQATPIDIIGSSGPISGTAQVNWGAIKVSGIAGYTATPTGGGAGITEIGQFADTNVIFHVPGLADGTLLTVTAGFSASGFLSVAPTCANACQAAWDAQMQLGTFFEVSGADLGVSFSGSPLGSYSHQFTVAVGLPTTLSLQLRGAADSTYDPFNPPTGLPFGDASDDLAHSMYWNGISSVTSGGVPVSSFAITSDSGMNWAQSFVPTTSTPEPAAGVLAGLLLVALRLVRRK